MKIKGRGVYEEYKPIVRNWKHMLLSGISSLDRKSRPNIIKQYSTFKGGVDLLDCLISFHRIRRKNRIRYLKIFFDLIGLTLASGWIMCRSNIIWEILEPNDFLDSLVFRSKVAEVLCLMDKNILLDKRTRTRNSVETDNTKKKRKGNKKINSTVWHKDWRNAINRIHKNANKPSYGPRTTIFELEMLSVSMVTEREKLT